MKRSLGHYGVHTLRINGVIRTLSERHINDKNPMDNQVDNERCMTLIFAQRKTKMNLSKHWWAKNKIYISEYYKYQSEKKEQSATSSLNILRTILHLIASRICISVSWDFCRQDVGLWPKTLWLQPRKQHIFVYTKERNNSAQGALPHLCNGKWLFF